MTEKQIGVIVSKHAKERFVERFPGTAVRDVVATIVYDIHGALEAGRMSKRCPSWTRTNYNNQLTRNDDERGTARYCWTEDETRCYGLRKRKLAESPRAAEYKYTWVVTTTLSRQTDEKLEQIDNRVRALRGIRKAERGGRLA